MVVAGTIAVALIALALIIPLARRRAARQHSKLSKSRRRDNTRHDILRELPPTEDQARRSRKSRRRRSRSSNNSIDLFSRDEGGAPRSDVSTPPATPEAQ